MRSTSLFRLSVLLFSLLHPSTAGAQIYADVQVAGAVSGSFTITLEHQKAPGAVANFIGLATGQRGWLDLKTGAIRYVPFYNGITFHRVIAGFMNQTGSPAGDGTDGPGYTFKDEFDPTLRHNAAYTVSMDNSGKQTNGSQFFITVGATPSLDDVHTIFGRVTAGQTVIDQINATPTTGPPLDRPLTPITIQSVNIYGPSLAAFNRDPAWLPKLRNARPVLTKNGATLTLAYDRLPFSEYIGFNGTNLSTWERFDVGYYAGIAPATDVDVSGTAGDPSHFYRMARVDYSACRNPFIPQTVASKSFTFTSNFPFISDVVFNAAGSGGTWSLRTSASGSIAAVNYTLAPYIPQLYMKWNSTAAYGFDLEFLYKLNYTSANGGNFTGQSNALGYTNIVGTFTVTP
jgi:peptidyl-prolyl cis-trans isomerase A (cyclophilin A)